jgi:serine/threonine-protein kinase HipA
VPEIIKIKGIDIITVRFNSEVLGRIALTTEGLAAFEYDKQWLKKGFAISPFFLPLQQGVFTAKHNPFDGNFGVFADSLPDGWGNLLLDRLLNKHQIDPRSINILQRLAIVGKNGMGALSYEPEFTIASSKVSSDLNAISKEVEKILKEEESINDLEKLWTMAGSSAGARPKVLVKHNNEHWLVKFPSSSDPKNIGEIEYQYSLLAKKAGIDMPETKLFEGRFFGTKRFDIINNQRLHVHSAAGLLHVDFRLPSLDYTELIKATRAITRNEKEVEKMFRLMVFNVLIGNRDDHAKNFSFLYSHNQRECSPAYDILPSNGINGEHTTSIAGNGKPKKDDIFSVAQQTAFSEKKAKEIYEEVYSTV